MKLCTYTDFTKNCVHPCLVYEIQRQGLMLVPDKNECVTFLTQYNLNRNILKYIRAIFCLKMQTTSVFF